MHVVYNSFNGRFSDNPRAIYERLRGRPGTEHTWLLDPPHAAAFPPDVRTVPIDSAGAREALEAADLVVAGTHTEVEWTKDPATTYLQTWHGTPLKRIHYDCLMVLPGRLDYLDLDVARWDVLLSPNPVSTPRLRKAFGFDGPIWETGYPRNDLLLSPDATVVRARVRAELGIADGTTAVLYAPTWRDDERYDGRADEVPMHLHLGALAARLSSGGTRHTVLARVHNLMTHRLHPEQAPGVVDVSFYRDIRDLYLAADVLVTDYSSVMFDFALTGKPIVYYPYDLDRYRDEIRGFYFDLLPQAPGPVAWTEDELVDTLLRLDPGRWAGPYAAFRATYGVLEDGHATDRVLDLLGLGTGTEQPVAGQAGS
ncbi:MAG: CDP-glycerol glycerophosphotransferase family protein [Nocardioidaceae bacterium]